MSNKNRQVEDKNVFLQHITLLPEIGKCTCLQKAKLNRMNL